MTSATTEERLRVLCILNRKSRDGNADKLWLQISELFAAAGIDAQVVDISHETLATDVENQLLTGEYSVVVGMGGDGTHFAVFNTLKAIERRLPGLAIPPYIPVPMGTGNNVAKSLGLGHLRGNLELVPELIRHGRDHKMDLGRFRDIYFADSVSIGLDAYVVARRDRLREALPQWLRPFVHGYLIFGAAGAAGMLRAPRLQCEISVDGRQWYCGPYGNIILNNTNIYGGIFDPCPDCRYDDGILNLIMAANRFSYATACALSLRCNPKWLRNWKGKRPGGLHFCSVPVRNCQITLEPPAPVQVDGEVIGIRQQVEVSVEQQAITVRCLDD